MIITWFPRRNGVAGVDPDSIGNGYRMASAHTGYVASSNRNTVPHCDVHPGQGEGGEDRLIGYSPDRFKNRNTLAPIGFWE